MVLDYYNLNEQPFGVTPDPRYLYYSAVHREALATLSYGIRSGRGFMSLIAEPGMGKTTILFQLLSQLQGSARTVFLFQTLCTPKELLQSLLRDLGVMDYSENAIRMQQQLNEVLLAEARRRRRVVVVIDEAQNLDDSALELVRMLSNFETSSDKLLQIILAGQPRLREKLASPQLLQLRQRMSIFTRLHPFSSEETRLYVRHRLQVAGYHFKTPLFTPQAGALIAKYSGGIPRNINNICFNALSLGCVLKQKSIREEVVRESLADLDLAVEGTDGRHEEAARQVSVAFKASNSGAESQPSFAWLGRLAVGLIVFLQILFFTSGRQIPKALGASSLLAVEGTSQPGMTKAASAEPLKPSDAVPAPSDGTGFRSDSERVSGDETSGIPETLSSTALQKPAQQFRHDMERTSDPAMLWAEVRSDNSDAEVDLAALYLKGTAVPQNCAQAKILLQAASRRGNPRAADLLREFGGIPPGAGSAVDQRCYSLGETLPISAGLDSRLKNSHE